MTSLSAWEDRARAALREDVWAYIAAGAGEERTMTANLEAWRSLELRPRVLRDVSSLELGTAFLGESARLPIGVAPTGRHLLVHPGGEAATADGAARAGVPFILSYFSTQALEDVARAAAPGIRWLQLPMGLDRAHQEELTARAKAAGFGAIVVTVDQPIAGFSPRALRRPVAVGEGLRHAHAPGAPRAVIAFDPSFDTEQGLALDRTTDDLATLVSRSPLPVVVKGVLRGDDAVDCLAAGAAALIVSNHGGRHLDGAVSSARALREVAGAVAGRAEVYVDGGIRWGTDVLRALALGADGVFLGRAPLWGLAVDGADGVLSVIEQVGAELRTAMALCGTPRFADLSPDILDLN
jgi:4-hydroxymandelate oxidase